jgi:hypothetical protein
MQAAVCERGVYLVLSHTWYLDQGVSGDGEQATAGPGNMIVSEREGSPARASLLKSTTRCEPNGRNR